MANQNQKRDEQEREATRSAGGYRAPVRHPVGGGLQDMFEGAGAGNGPGETEVQKERDEGDGAPVSVATRERAEDEDEDADEDKDAVDERDERQVRRD